MADLERSKIQLGQGHVEIVPVSESHVRFLEGRDVSCFESLVPKKPQDNLFKDFPVLTDGRVTRAALRANGVDVGYVMAGVFTEGPTNIGEVAMVRVSPVITGLGAGSVLLNYGTATLFEHGRVDVLRAEVADRTGRVERFIQKIGMSVKGYTPGIGGHRLYERILEGPDAVDIYDRTQKAIEDRISKLVSNQEFWQKLPGVERDDSLADGFGDLVEKRVSQTNFQRPGRTFDVVYAGYPGARLMVALVNAGESVEAVEAYVRGVDPVQARQVLGSRINGYSLRQEDFGLGAEFAGVALRGRAARQMTALEDLRPITELSVDLVRQLNA